MLTVLSATLHAILNRLIDVINTLQSTGPSALGSAYSALLTVSPLFLIILGVITFFAGSLAKFVGIIIIIVGIFLLLLPYLGFMH